jgi:hypothetical protein
MGATGSGLDTLGVSTIETVIDGGLGGTRIDVSTRASRPSILESCPSIALASSASDSIRCSVIESLFSTE